MLTRSRPPPLNPSTRRNGYMLFRYVRLCRCTGSAAIESIVDAPMAPSRGVVHLGKASLQRIDPPDKSRNVRRDVGRRSVRAGLVTTSNSSYHVHYESERKTDED